MTLDKILMMEKSENVAINVSFIHSYSAMKAGLGRNQSPVM